MPLFILSEQQQKVYMLAKDHSTGEIAEILTIPEKQVRQVYSAIRRKSKEFANKYVPEDKGGKYACFYQLKDEATPGYDDLYIDLVENNGHLSLTASELFVLENVKKGISIREISQLTGKTVEAIRKMDQRAKRKISKKYSPIDHNCIIKIDTGKTCVKINFELIRQAVEKLNLTLDQVSSNTGIPLERINQIERDRTLNYDELFALIKYLGFNPYGPSEKDRLAEKLTDTGWIHAARMGKTCDRHWESGSGKKGREKAKYRNRVMYYGTASYRYNNYDREKPLIEDGRNGFFPLTLTREQQAQCRWLLKGLMLKPVFTYRYSGLDQEINKQEEAVSGKLDCGAATSYKNKITLWKDDFLHENGRSIYLVNKYQMAAIKQALFGQ
ncbi:MAG: helix-turn-helix domain-containing protein [Bacillota bacterium]